MKQHLLLADTAIASFVLTLAFSSWREGLWRPAADAARAGQNVAVVSARRAAPPAPFVRPAAGPAARPAVAVADESRTHDEGQPPAAADDAAARAPGAQANAPEFFTGEPGPEPRSSRTR
jgi:hypothetical protein